MDIEKELEIINRLLAEEEENYYRKQLEKKNKEKEELYQELFQDKVNGILGG